MLWRLFSTVGGIHIIYDVYIYIIYNIINI